jgi:hypothetical protein
MINCSKAYISILYLTLSANLPRAKLPRAIRISQLANIIPIDSSLPEKVTKSSLINKISIISEAKPLNSRAKLRLFSNIMLLFSIIEI